jgi:hypothetical protein
VAQVGITHLFAIGSITGIVFTIFLPTCAVITKIEVHTVGLRVTWVGQAFVDIFTIGSISSASRLAHT